MKLDKCLGKLSNLMTPQERADLASSLGGMDDAGAIQAVSGMVEEARADVQSVMDAISAQQAAAEPAAEAPAPQTLDLGPFTFNADRNNGRAKLDVKEVPELNGKLGEPPIVVIDRANGRALNDTEQQVIAAAIRDLIDRGMPKAMLDGVRSFYVREGYLAGEYHIEGQSIGISADVLEAAGLGNKYAISSLRGMLAHELAHHEDEDPQTNIPASVASGLFALEDTGMTRVPRGKMMIEAFIAWRKGGEFGRLMDYPFSQYKRHTSGNPDQQMTDRGYNTGDFTWMLTQEVYAQLRRLWFTNNVMLRANAPLAHAFFEEMQYEHGREGTIGGHRRAIREGLRRWRPADDGRRAVELQAADRADGEGDGGGQADRGVGAAQPVRPVGKERLEHRYAAEAGRETAGSAVRQEAPREGAREAGPGDGGKRPVQPTVELGGLASTPVHIRPRQPDAVTVVGVHYSGRDGITQLAGGMYGSATSRYAGEEFARVQGGHQAVKKRVYFYAQTSNEVPRPEELVTGQHVYTATLSNILHPDSETGRRLSKQARSGGEFDANAYEKSVVDAGYDGYYNPYFGREGAVVVLAADVPVKSLGTKQDLRRPKKLEVQAGGGRQATLADFGPGKVAKILRKTDWAIISAENPDAKSLSPALNAARNKRLERDLKKLGVQYEQVVGRYGGNDENSFIVVGITAEQANELRDKYHQDATLTRRGFEHADGSITPAKGVTEHATAPADYFSRTASGAYFSVDLDWDARTKPTRLPRDLAPHVTAEEMQTLSEGQGRVAKLIAVMKELPATREFEHAALAGRAARGWYRRSREAIEAKYGADAPRFIALMAALSPQTDVEGNFYNAAMVWHAWDNAGRPQDNASLRQILTDNLVTDAGREGGKSAMEAWTQNSIRTLTSQFPERVILSGPKVESFRRNLMGDMYEVTNDRHNAAFGGIEQALFGGQKTKGSPVSGKGPGYIAFSARMREAAANLTRATGETWTPAEAQETLWSFWKALYDLTTAKGETRSALELVRAGALTHEMVRRVPDLGSFINEPRYKRIAGARGEEVARGEREEAVQEPPRETGAIAATPAIERIARRLDRLVEKRRRLEELKAQISEQNEQLDEAGIARQREIDQLREEIAQAEADFALDEALDFDIEDRPRRPERLDVELKPSALWESGLKIAINDRAPFSKGGQTQPKMLKSWLAARAQDGTVKSEELKWSGIDEWLDALIESDIKQLSREEINNFIDDNGVRVQEVMYGSDAQARLEKAEKDLIAYLIAKQKFTKRGARDYALDAARGDLSEPQFAAIEDAEHVKLVQDLMAAYQARNGGYGSTQYHEHVLPGGWNYTELLLTLPPEKSAKDRVLDRIQKRLLAEGEKEERYSLATDIARGYVKLTPEEATAYNAAHRGDMRQRWKLIDSEHGDVIAVGDRQAMERWLATEAVFNGDQVIVEESVPDVQASERRGKFMSSHWDVPNILAHVRFDERVDADGKRVLFVEEIQSDWAQKGRAAGFAPPDSTPRPERRTELPEGWSVRKKLGRSRNQQREQIMEEHSRVVQELKAQGFAGSVEKAIAGFGDKWYQMKNDWALVRQYLDQTGGAVDREIKGNPEEAFVNYVVAIRSRVPDAFNLMTLKTREEWGAYYGNLLQATGKTEKDATEAALDKIHRSETLVWEAARNKGVPAGPFVGKTEAWVALALKRMIRYAADNGFDRVAWTNGEQQAERYNLSRHIQKVSVFKPQGQTHGYVLEYKPVNSTLNEQLRLPHLSDLHEYIGVELAEKARDHFAGWDGKNPWVVSGLDLKVGGEGMKAFYDKIIPNVANDLLKKMGGSRVRMIDMQGRKRTAPKNSDRWRGAPHPRINGKWAVYDSVEDDFNGTFDTYDEAVAEAMARNAPPAEGGTSQPGFDLTPEMLPRAKRPQRLFVHEGLMRNAQDRISDTLRTQRTFNQWHRTVGTQYHKAQIDEDFRPVYQGVQDYLNDSSQMMMEASDLAPDILPRLSGLRDVLKAGPRGESMKRVSDAVFTGTLEDRVYSDAELEQKGLDDRERGLYRQARAAIDRVLDEAFASEAVKEARGLLPRQTLERAKEAGDGWIIVDALSAMTMDQRTPLHQQVYDQLRLRAAEIANLKQAGYAPLMRFGQYTVTVRNAAGDVQLFTMHESEREANAMARAVRSDPEMRGMAVEQGVMAQEAWKLFQGVSPDALEVFAQALDATEKEVFQKYIKFAVNNRSVLKRMLHRQKIPGFNDDVQRTLAQFITSTSRAAARNYHWGDILKAAEKIANRKGDVKDEAAKLIEYVRGQSDDAGGLRGLLFVQFLGGSVASAAVNATQPVLMSFPYLSRFGGAIKAASRLMAATKVALGGRPEAGLDEAMRKAAEQGITDPHEVAGLYAESIRNFGSNMFTRRALRVWGSFFSLAEAFNRRLTFAAAYRTAVEEGIADPYAFAVQAIAETQGVYNKGNRPDWARGPVGATLMTFKQYSVAYLEFLKRLPPKERAIALAVLILAAGLQGLPGADDVEDVVDTVAESLGYNFNSKQAMREWAVNTLGEPFGEFLVNGFSSLPGVPLDVQARLGVGNLIPGTALLKRSEPNKSKEILDVFGPAGGQARSAMQAFTAAQEGDYAAAGKSLVPVALRNALKGLEMAQTGWYKDERGRRVIDVDSVDAAIKGVGFQPSRVARQSRVVQDLQQTINLQRDVEARIAETWARGIVEQDPAKVQRARAELIAWNATNPEARVLIAPAQIQKRVQQMLMTREQRFIKTAPTELRQKVAEELRR